MTSLPAEPGAAAMAAIRNALDGNNVGEWHEAGRRLLAAVDEALKPHAPRTDRVLGSSCFTHRTALNTMVPLPGCEDCVQDRPREVCPECRDEYGDPVLFQDCRARTTVLAALTGKAHPGGER